VAPGKWAAACPAVGCYPDRAVLCVLGVLCG